MRVIVRRSSIITARRKSGTIPRRVIVMRVIVRRSSIITARRKSGTIPRRVIVMRVIVRRSPKFIVTAGEEIRNHSKEGNRNAGNRTAELH